jgi:hypothetical protein
VPNTLAYFVRASMGKRLYSIGIWLKIEIEKEKNLFENGGQNRIKFLSTAALLAVL